MIDWDNGGPYYRPRCMHCFRIIRRCPCCQRWVHDYNARPEDHDGANAHVAELLRSEAVTP